MKTFLGIAATLLALYSYIPYFRDIFAGKTKPHAFSWLVWFLLTAIAFVAQVKANGGAGSWVTGFTAFIAFLIFIAALGNYSVVTTFYPASLVLMNGLFVTMLIIRRKQLGITKEKHTEVIAT